MIWNTGTNRLKQGDKGDLMGEIKQRDYSFDIFRGICMWAIPVSHFTRMGGCFSQDSWGGVVYITINVFIMQSFMFLSGYFSKNVKRGAEHRSKRLCGRIF